MNTLQDLNYVLLVFYTTTFKKLKQSGKVEQNCYLFPQGCVNLDMANNIVNKFWN